MSDVGNVNPVDVQQGQPRMLDKDEQYDRLWKAYLQRGQTVAQLTSEVAQLEQTVYFLQNELKKFTPAE